MAKKRRITENKPVEEEYEFIPPEFDEKEFILKDFYGTKITLVVALFSVIIGALCGCLQICFATEVNGTPGLYLGLALYFLAMFAIKPLLRLVKLDPDRIEGKSMVGNYLVYLLLGLGVWILFVNPPIFSGL